MSKVFDTLNDYMGGDYKWIIGYYNNFDQERVTQRLLFLLKTGINQTKDVQELKFRIEAIKTECDPTTVLNIILPTISITVSILAITINFNVSIKEIWLFFICLINIGIMVLAIVGTQKSRLYKRVVAYLNTIEGLIDAIEK